MKLVLKFNDGLNATVDNFSDLPRERTGEDFFDVLNAIKENNSPVNVTDEKSGMGLSRSGKDLVAVEILLD